MIAPEKFFTFTLKTTYKKLFLKYQGNVRFPSLSLASGKAIFGGGIKKKKKKSRQVHRGSCPN